MEDSVANLLSLCSHIDFGAVKLSEEEKEFSRDLNNEIISLCKSLPESMQTEATLFLMRYLQTSLLDGVNFVRYFYAPAWSMLYWLMKSNPYETRLEQTDIQDAKTGHTMAMFLHAIDDHLTDGQLPITHLALLLRSQSWMVMNHAFRRLANGVDGGVETIQGLISDYYSGIYASNNVDVESLGSYSDLFRKQMATAFVVPVLIAKKMTIGDELADAVQAAYGSFGVAWRLLDDLQDIEKDMMEGVHSSVYFCLSEELRDFWDETTEEKKGKNSRYAQHISDYLYSNRVVDRIKERICSELESAASISDYYNMAGLAAEFRCLSKPLEDGQDHL